MKLENSQILALFKEMYLFSGLSDEQLNWASSLFSQVEYPADTTIFMPGQMPDGFYIIASGEVYLTQKILNTMTDVDVMVPGDFFGEEGLLLRRAHRVAVATAGEATLLKAGIAEFNELIRQCPSVRVNLERMVQSRTFIRKHHFRWLNPDEVIYQVRRKHEAYLVVRLLPPAFAALVALIIALVGVLLMPPSDLETVFLIILGVVFTAMVLWAVWRWLDWSNDYYVVTNQRVVWIEQVIGLYESQVEAPHSTIKTVESKATLLGQILGYGDVLTTTITGRVVFAHIGEPKLMEALIREQWHRSDVNFQKTQQEELVRTVRRIMHPGQTPQERPPAIVEPITEDDYSEPSVIAKYFSNIFQMRYEKDNTITYRKHWIVLLRKAWKPLLTLTLILTGTIAYLVMYGLKYIRIISPLPVLAISILLLLVVVLPWWLYNYVDWRNDIYQLTDKNIFDIEKRPLGTIQSNSASLERILSLEHERPGFIGYLLNVGNVVINLGESKLTFDGVYEPARVQKDIFQRMHQLRIRQQKAEIAREQDRILALLEIYHKNVHEDEGSSE